MPTISPHEGVTYVPGLSVTHVPEGSHNASGWTTTDLVAHQAPVCDMAPANRSKTRSCCHSHARVWTMRASVESPILPRRVGLWNPDAASSHRLTWPGSCWNPWWREGALFHVADKHSFAARASNHRAVVDFRTHDIACGAIINKCPIASTHELRPVF